MPVEWLSSLSILAITLGMFALMLVSAMMGQLARRLPRLGRTPKVAESEVSIAHEGYALAAALGLLGLLLAFSFGMVLNRYEARRDLAAREANAIGTAYLRAQLLDEPHRSRLARLLVDYAENRAVVATMGADAGPLLATNDRLLTEIWAAVRAARGAALAQGLTTSLLMAVNEVIDLDAERKLAWQLRLPGEVLIMLVAYLGVTSGVVGYAVDGPRGRRSTIVLFVLISLSIGIMTDLNRPMSGTAREPQEAFQLLLQSLKSQAPEVFDVFASPGEPATNPGSVR